NNVFIECYQIYFCFEEQGHGLLNGRWVKAVLI
ncbi:hypothetical protein HKBW3S03_01701, partial [Candidatus Hakubella thermalkaliphila]